jgi:hypothetical protein
MASAGSARERRIVVVVVTILMGIAVIALVVTAFSGSSKTAVPLSSSGTTTTATAPNPSTATSTTQPAGRAATATNPGAVALVRLAIEQPSGVPTYHRTAFGSGWEKTRGCENTRAAVLIKVSLVPVPMNKSGCSVLSGRWTDPWSGTTTTKAAAFDIDHTVPLENAWVSGAWNWTAARRLAFANDTIDADHLVPIAADENRAKGADGPDRWKPPLRSTWCRYALDWDRIKAKWHLSATAAEWAALQEMVATC